MDFLNEAIRQTKDTFSSMTIGARIASALLLAAIVVSLAYLFVFRTESGTEFLYSGDILSREDQAKVSNYLSEAGLKDWKTEGGRIKVPTSQVHKYYAALSAKNFIPQSPGGDVKDALGNEGLFKVPIKIRQERLLNAKQIELSRIISSMKGIASAWVRIDQQRTRGLHGELKATALASVTAEGGRHLNEDQLRAIRNAVAARYSPVRRKDVSILDPIANYTYGGEDGIGLLDDKYAAKKRMYERQYKQKIQNMVGRMIPGVGVEVNVELDPSEGTTTSEYKLDPKTVPYETVETTKESKSSGGNNGRPGAAPNGVGNRAAQVAANSGTQNSKTETSNRTKTRTGATRVQTRKAGFLPKVVRAAVSIPESYYISVWKEKQATTGAAKKGDTKAPGPGDLAKIKSETETKIKSIVSNLFPELPPGVNQFPHVTVQSYHDLPVTPPAAPSMVSGVFAWLGDNWSTLGMLGLGGFCLMMFRGVITAAKPVIDGSPAQEQALAAAEAEFEEEMMEDESGLLRRFSASGRGLRDELSELVREDPDAAASVLKNWIGEAA